MSEGGVYTCYYTIPAKQVGDPKNWKPAIRVFVCGVCKRELGRVALDGVPQVSVIEVEGCCGALWRKW